MKVFLPYRGEFGYRCFFHAPQVHAALTPGVDVVCCPDGMEALYPDAADYIITEDRPDPQRRGAVEDEFAARYAGLASERYGPDVLPVHPNFRAARKYFVPKPHIPVQVAPCDIVVCPRRRDYGADKNWPHWQGLIDQLTHSGLRVFAAGAADSSYDVDCHGFARRAWDYGRSLDVSLRAILQCRSVIATDAGLAHLAVLCGRPLLMITHAQGLVAAGTDDRGNAYWPVMIDRYRAENHLNAPIRMVQHAWDDPDKVARAAAEFLADLEAQQDWRVAG